MLSYVLSSEMNSLYRLQQNSPQHIKKCSVERLYDVHVLKKQTFLNISLWNNAAFDDGPITKLLKVDTLHKA